MPQQIKINPNWSNIAARTPKEASIIWNALTKYDRKLVTEPLPQPPIGPPQPHIGPPQPPIGPHSSSKVLRTIVADSYHTQSSKINSRNERSMKMMGHGGSMRKKKSKRNKKRRNNKGSK